MPYDPAFVQPMREELQVLGFEDLRTPEVVEEFLRREGGKLLFVNSVCGCAAGQARPALRLALQHEGRPEHLGSVFAGQDLEATAAARARFAHIPPSSPSVFLLRDGDVVSFVPRHMIENRDAMTIAHDLVSAFESHFAPR